MEDARAASVIICTYDRRELLMRAVEGCVRQSIEDARGFEVLVVDNECSSETEAFVSRMNADVQPCELRYVAQPRIGHIHARNAGLQRARGEIVVFLDDDAIPCGPNWLATYLECFENGKIGAVGGPVFPAFGGPRPDWLSRHLEAKYSILEFFGAGPSRSYRRPIPFPSRLLPIGANLAFRKELLGAFDARTGRVGEGLRSRDELPALHAVEHAGYEVWLADGAAVTHHVPAQRLTREWILARSDAEGRSRVADRLARGQSRALAACASICHAAVTALLAVSLLFSLARGRTLAARCRWREALGELRAAIPLKEEG